MDEETRAQLLELALARRPERVANHDISALSPDQAAEVSRLREVLALLPLGDVPVAPGPALRARLLQTLEARTPGNVPDETD